MNNNYAKEGCVDIWIDELTECLIDTETGKRVETIVFRIEKRSFLKKFSKKNGWRINWYSVPKDVEVFALATSSDDGSIEIEGLVGIKNDIPANAVYVHWAVAAPHNNKHDFGSQKYKGVGGHLFAIAAEKSLDYGHGGFIHAFALNEELLKHYCETLGAIYIGAQHQYQFIIDEEHALRLMEVYDYDWENT